MLLLGPVGVWVLEHSDVTDDYKRLFQSFCWLLRDIRVRVVDKSSIPELDTRAKQILTEFEIKLPLFIATINQHLILHEPARRLEIGGSWISWL